MTSENTSHPHSDMQIMLLMLSRDSNRFSLGLGSLAGPHEKVVLWFSVLPWFVTSLWAWDNWGNIFKICVYLIFFNLDKKIISLQRLGTSSLYVWKYFKVHVITEAYLKLASVGTRYYWLSTGSKFTLQEFHQICLPTDFSRSMIQILTL